MVVYGGNVVLLGMVIWLKLDGVVIGDLFSVISFFNDWFISEVDVGFFGWFINVFLFRK